MPRLTPVDPATAMIRNQNPVGAAIESDHDTAEGRLARQVTRKKPVVVPAAGLRLVVDNTAP